MQPFVTLCVYSVRRKSYSVKCTIYSYTVHCTSYIPYTEYVLQCNLFSANVTWYSEESRDTMKRCLDVTGVHSSIQNICLSIEFHAADRLWEFLEWFRLDGRFCVSSVVLFDLLNKLRVGPSSPPYSLPFSLLSPIISSISPSTSLSLKNLA